MAEIIDSEKNLPQIISKPASNGMKILLTGGGTLGSVSPLVAIWQSLKEKTDQLDVLFVGTKKGPEFEFLKTYNFSFVSLPVVKFRRYFSLENFFDLFKCAYVLLKSFFILLKFKPAVIVSAGGFTAVPIIWASVFFKIKVIIYQSDLQPGLANKLCQRQANFIFTAFPETIKEFPVHKTILAGSIVRTECKKIDLKKNRKTNKILILGGGSGSEEINNLVISSLKKLTEKYYIIHVTGRNKKTKFIFKNYEAHELLYEDYYQKINEADLVISRAGLSTLMELSFLHKPAILIPLPDSSQVLNARYFSRKFAAIQLPQSEATPEKLVETINQTLSDQKLLERLSHNSGKIFLPYAEQKISQMIIELCK